MDLVLKVCSKCDIEKDISEFHKDKRAKDGLSVYCKVCVSRDGKKYRIQNKEKIDKYQEKYYQKNKEKKCKQQKEYRMKNPKKTCKLDEKHNKKRRQTLQGKLSNSISKSIWYSLKSNKAGMHWESIMGYTLSDVMSDIEFQFANGMNWKNYGKWHIHHRIPISLWQFKFYTDREFKQCFALCNLQPLWAEENLSKNNRML